MEDTKNMLVVAPNWVGDSIFFLPAIVALRRQYPGAAVTLLAKRSISALHGANILFDRRLPLPGGRWRNFKLAWSLRRQGFDLAVVFPDSFSSGLGAFLCGAGIRLGRAKQGRSLFLTQRLSNPDNDRRRHVSKEYMDLAVAAGATEQASDYKVTLALTREGLEEQERLFQEAGFGPNETLIGICPTSAYGPAKCWPPEYFGALIVKLMQAGLRPVLLGAPSEAATLSGIERAAGVPVPRLLPGLPGLAACLARMKAVLANDSGPLHVAAALRVPVAGLFGPVDPQWSGPLAEKAKVFYTGISCSPCYARVCPLKHHKCLREISPESVLQGLLDLIA